MVPLVSGKILTNDLMVVDFPAPLCPINPTISPLSIVKFKLFKATLSPYFFVACLNSIIINFLPSCNYADYTPKNSALLVTKV